MCLGDVFFRYRSALCALFILVGVAVSANETILISAGSPVNVKPDFNSELIGVSQKDNEAILLDSKPIIHYYNRHPLAFYHYYYHVRIADGREGYYSPDIYAEKNADGNFSPSSIFQVEWWRSLLVFIVGVVFAASTLLLLRSYRDGYSDKIKSVAMVGFIVSLRQLLVLGTALYWGNAIASASDDPGYFATAIGILNGEYAGPWTFTIGLGFLYMPFILLLNAKEFYDIAIPFGYFSAVVLAPSTLVVGFFILRKLKFSLMSSFVTLCLWAIWPIIYHHAEIWNNNTFFSFFSLPSSLWFYYHVIIGGGFNAMSDVSSTLFLFIAIYIALSIPLKRRYIYLLGMIFGFACLIRINNIFFAPLLAYITLFRFCEIKRNWSYILSIFGIAAISFLAIFIWQLLVNLHQFGSMFTFPYILHATDFAGPKPNDGFTFLTLFKGVHVKYLAHVNYAVWALGISGLLLIKDSYRRTLFALWIIPVIMFFYGYSHTFCDARRFILSTYLPMFAAFVGLKVWSEVPKKILYLALGGIIASLLMVTPTKYDAPWMLAPPLSMLARVMSVMAPIYMLGLTYYLYKLKYKNLAVAVLVFSIIYFAGHGYIYAGLLLLILLRAVWDLFKMQN